MNQAVTIPMARETKKHIVSAVKEYSARLFGFIRSRVGSDQDAEDVLQDVWYQLSNLAGAGAMEQIGGWLFTVARNKITDRRRKHTTESLEDLAGAQDEDEEGLGDFNDILFADDATPETEYMRQMFWDALFAALDELPLPQRQAFVWNELEGMTFQDMADLSGENIKTLISRKRYAVMHLRKRLQNLYDDILYQ